MPQPTQQQLLDWDRHHYWHGFTQMAGYEPFIIERAYGATLVDIRGREYLDGVSSLWCNVHGHRHPKIDEAIRRQLSEVAHCTSLGVSNPTTIRLARRLSELLPEGLDHVFFSSDGACAVEVALKMAFQYWRQCETPEPERTKFIALGDAYHGDTLGSVSVGGIDFFHALYRSLLFEVVRVPSPDPRRLPQGISRDVAAAYYLEQLEKVLSNQSGEIAAMIMEPLVQGAAGMIMHPAGYFQGVRNLCTQYHVLLIADEVATGFGRTGTMFACMQEEVVPDILCLGKGLTGGYLPMSATIASTKIWKAFLGGASEKKTFFHGHTYGGNPLAAAAALASLELFEEEGTLRQLVPKMARLGVHLSRLAKHPHVADARQTGFMAAVELVQNKPAGQPYPSADQMGWRVCQDVLDRGIWIRPLGDTLVIMPPFCITMNQLDRMMEAISRGIEVVTARFLKYELGQG
ncbi:MAG: adenosylmethionine--8-amino-7-oxononanoate transaminase [Pirellulales bacterium]|nr:adenosylmethionine--8-amino-7-oxononanoate transaminase [Pirellulales bacterium]